MPEPEMVSVMTASDGFEARVVAARLGADGIVWQLRGNVDGPYPLGSVEVLVDAADYEVARELLIADAVEDAFVAGQRDGDEARSARRERWILCIALFAVVLFTIGRVLVHAG